MMTHLFPGEGGGVVNRVEGLFASIFAINTWFFLIPCSRVGLESGSMHHKDPLPTPYQNKTKSVSLDKIVNVKLIESCFGTVLHQGEMQWNTLTR